MAVTAVPGCARRTAAVLGVLALVVTTLAWSAPAGADHVDETATPDDREVVRLEGGDREGTAAAIARYTFGEDGHGTASPTHAIIARRDVEFDALAASFLAGCLEAPVLLTPRAPFTAGDGSSHDIHPTTLAALDDLGVDNVVLLGQAAALSDEVADAFEDEGYEVERIGGQFREDTAADIARYEGCGIGIVEGMRTAIVARSDVSADALSAGGIAYDGGFPVLLTGRTALSSQAADTLDALDIDLVLILGGTGAISQAVQDDLTARGYDTFRLWGEFRDQTAIAIAQFAVDQMGWELDEVGLARWDRPWDAMTSSPYAGGFRSPLLLTHTDAIGHSCGFIADHHDDIVRISVFGGPSAVSLSVASAAAGCAPLPPDELTLSPQARTLAFDDTHTVTATVTDEDDVRVDARVRFELYRVAEDDAGGLPVLGGDAEYTLRQVAETTTTNGRATHQYTYDGEDGDADDVIVACVITEDDERENDEPFCADVDAEEDSWESVEAREDIPADDAMVRWRDEAEEDPDNGNGAAAEEQGLYTGMITSHQQGDGSGTLVVRVTDDPAPGVPEPGQTYRLNYGEHDSLPDAYRVNGTVVLVEQFQCAVNATLGDPQFPGQPDPTENHQIVVGYNPGGPSTFELWTPVPWFTCFVE